jgi:hypothetical protein
MVQWTVLSGERREFKRAAWTDRFVPAIRKSYLPPDHTNARFRSNKMPGRHTKTPGATMKKLTGILTALSLSCAIASPVAADPANLLGAFQNWSAYSSGTGSSLTCYALSKPRATEPKTAKRAPIYLMISDWPARKVKAEPQIVYGYQAKEGAPASLGIGGDKFTFFIRNVGKDGSGWLQSLPDNARLINAMGQGVSAVAKGESARGTKTTDTYSLAGFGDALAKIHAVCNM